MTASNARRAPREHGTKACYVFGPVGNDTKGGCRCDPCRDAQRVYNRELRQRIVPAYVAAARAREHIAALSAHGVGLKQVARMSGVSHGALSKLVYGTGDGRPPSKRIRPETEQAILAVQPNAAAPGARVPAARTWELIDEMVAAGVPKVRIAELIGNRRALQLSRATVTADNAQAVAVVHRMWRSGALVVHRHDSHGGSVAVAPPPPTTPPPEAVTPFAVVGDLVARLATAVEVRNGRDWRTAAACRGRPAWMWFPARGDRVTLEAALKVCRSCTVRASCLAENLHEDDGIYGGTTRLERKQLRVAS